MSVNDLIFDYYKHKMNCLCKSKPQKMNRIYDKMIKKE